MRDIGISIAEIAPWFAVEQDAPFTLIRVSDADADSWTRFLVDAVRRCYIADDELTARAEATDTSQSEVLAAVLPDPGSVMSGDFGEIVVFLYQASAENPPEAVGPKKWRLKNDRTKPAPYSDVVQFFTPEWPTPSEHDRVACAEVKTKSTNGNSTPITSAIADSSRDSLGRLASTLVWLRERALLEDLGSTTIQLLDRFIDAIDHPPMAKRFRAVAVLSTSILDSELTTVPDEIPAGVSLTVIAVPDLKRRYEDLFAAVANSGIDS